MPFRKHLLLPLLGLALLLGGCGPSVSYSYIPPTSDAGLHCVSQCNAEKRQCKTLAKLQQRQDEALYQAQSTAYNYCMQNSDKKKRKSCPTRSATSISATTARTSTAVATSPAAAPSAASSTRTEARRPAGIPDVRQYRQAKTKYLRTVSTTSQVPRRPGSMTNTSPALRCTGCSPSGVMMQ